MASIKIKFRPSTVPDNEGSIYYQIIHDRKVRQIQSKYKIMPSEWDDKRSMVTTICNSDRREFILSIREHIRWDMERLNKISRKLDDEGLLYSADDIIEHFTHYVESYTLFNYMQSLILKLKRKGKIRTAETYRSALNSFKKFRNNEDLLLDSLTSDIMEEYMAWHQKRGVTLNTISFYTRILRAVYNRAIEEDVVVNRYPFRHVFTGSEKTRKRALSLSNIKKLRLLDLTENPKYDFARDMFLLSFMLRGMSLIDMAYLRKSDLTYGYISYRRRKTGQRIIIKWTYDMEEILKKYPENPTGYLLPIIRKVCPNDRALYLRAGYHINKSLKGIAKLIGLSSPLTLYAARHSWASVAKSTGIPIGVISEGMGHNSEMTTQIYLTDLDTNVIDNANALILKSIL